MNVTKNIEKLNDSDYRLNTKDGFIFRNNNPKSIPMEEVLKDVQNNHNHSWYDELYERNKYNLGKTALVYRGNEISYYDMFDKMSQYAKAMKFYGLGRGSEIPVCLSNTPEMVYILGAASIIGASVNIFGPKFSKDYITEIIKGTGSNLIFIEDNHYEKLKESIDEAGIENIVMISLRSSLKDDYNPYAELDYKLGLFKNKLADYKGEDYRIIGPRVFCGFGDLYKGKVKEESVLDDDFIITYTSGTTNSSRPKAIVHANRCYITVARYHNTDLNGGISLKPYTFLALIPTYSNSNIMSIVSDSLMQSATLALEPVYDPDFFLDSLIIHNPNYVAATKSFWINAAKKILKDYKGKSVDLKNLTLAFSCGEPLEINEEKLINKALKKAQAGVNETHTPFSVIKLSEAGGDCEHGSIFYTLFRAYQNKKPLNLKNKVAAGLGTFDFVEFAVLDENNNRLGHNQYGRVVANSPCTMNGYRNNDDANKKFFITDSDGKKWADMNVYGYVDKSNKIHLKGRIPDENEIIPPFYISTEILKDTKNILSCEVVPSEDVDGLYIAHVELQPNCKKSIENVVNSAYQRCRSLLESSSCKLYFRIRSNEESFPLTSSGKRDINKLKREKTYSNYNIPASNNLNEEFGLMDDVKRFTKKK